MAKVHCFPATFLGFAALILLGTACSDDRSLVVLDVSLGPGVAEPATVRLHATQTGEVRTVDVAWKRGSASMQTGFFIPSGTTGKVNIDAKALDAQGNAFAAGTLEQAVELKVGGSVGPFPLVLAAFVNPPLPDGGVDSQTADTAGPGVEVGDGRADRDGGIDSALPDTRPAEVPGTDLIGVTEAGSADAADAPPTVDATPFADGADTSDAADVVLRGPDGVDAPADVVTAGEAGGEVAPTPSWQPAQNVENDRVASWGPAIAVDPVNEHVYVGWVNVTTVKVRRWNRSTGAWEPILTLDDRGHPGFPAIGADAKGNVMMTWPQNTDGADPTLDGVWFSRTTDGTTWSKPARFSTNPAFDARLAVARNGTAHAAYYRAGVSGWPLYTAYFDGTTWTPNPTTVWANPYNADLNPHIALGENGNGLLVFHKDYGLAATVLTGTSFGPTTMIDPNYETTTASYESVAANRKGEAIVAWTEGSVVLARTYSPTTAWADVGPPVVSSYWVAATGVAIDEQGEVTLMWQDWDTGGANMRGKHRSADGTWGPVTLLENDNVAGTQNLSTEYGYPQLAVDGSGNVLAVWRKEANATTYGAFGTRLARGSWLPQVQLGMKTGLDVYNLALSVADSGFGAAAFIYGTEATTTDPDADDVFVAFFR